MSKKKKAPPGKPAAKAFGGFHPLADKLAGLREERRAEPKAAERAAPAPAPPRAPPPRATCDDADLSFHRLMSGVTPLERRPERSAVDDARARRDTEAEAAAARLRSLVDDGVRFEVIDDGEHVEGRRLDAPPSLVRSLRRGALPVDAQLDLHGLSIDEARAKSLAFLAETRARGERCVLLIHGRGEGVLRGEIAAWLSQGRAREHVAAFCTAHRDDGGAGALYVALRR